MVNLNNNRHPKAEALGRGKIILKFGGFLVLAMFSYLIFTYLNSFFYQKQINHYSEKNITYIFKNIDFDRDGIYQLGFNFGKSEYLRKHQYQLKNDGNYTIEYYDKNRLIRKAYFNKHYHDLNFHYDSGSYFRSSFDQVKVPKDIEGKNLTIKIIAHKPLSFLNRFKEQNREVEFFIWKMPQKIVKLFEEANKPSKKSNKKSIDSVEFAPYDMNASKLAILKALFTKDTKKVKEIIEADNGIGIDTILGHRQVDIIRDRTPRMRTPIIYTAYFNDIETLKYLIDKGADINHKDYNHQNALGYAIYNDSVEAAKVLLESGAKVQDVEYVLLKKSKYNIETLSPLSAAVAKNSYEMTKLLLENGVKNYILFEHIYYTDSDPYTHIHDIDDYKRMLTLLIEYDVESPQGFKPTQEDFKRRYDGCTRGHTVDEICTPITDNNLALEDVDIYIYYEISYLSRKHQEAFPSSQSSSFGMPISTQITR